jgi:hypothetical protein
MRQSIREWIMEYGSDALQRAHAEGYGVRKGVADEILLEIEGGLELDVHTSWESCEERTSPSADSFALRDTVLSLVRSIVLPAGWSMDVSRISRITLDDSAKVTGVFVIVEDECGIVKNVAVDFETK